MSTSKRIFKTKTFDRWARGILTDQDLYRAAAEVMAGRFDADLGGGLCKKRIAPAGKGKSGATRTLIAKRHEGAIFFIAGRQKSDPGSDFSEREAAAARLVAKGLQAADDRKISELLAYGTIKEISDESKDSVES